MKDGDVIVSQAHQIAVLRKQNEQYLQHALAMEAKIQEMEALVEVRKEHADSMIAQGITSEKRIKKLERANERLKGKVAPKNSTGKRSGTNSAGMETTEAGVSAGDESESSIDSDTSTAVDGHPQVAASRR